MLYRNYIRLTCPYSLLATGESNTFSARFGLPCRTVTFGPQKAKLVTKYSSQQECTRPAYSGLEETNHVGLYPKI